MASSVSNCSLAPAIVACGNSLTWMDMASILDKVDAARPLPTGRRRMFMTEAEVSKFTLSIFKYVSNVEPADMEALFNRQPTTITHVKDWDYFIRFSPFYGDPKLTSDRGITKFARRFSTMFYAADTKKEKCNSYLLASAISYCIGLVNKAKNGANTICAKIDALINVFCTAYPGYGENVQLKIDFATPVFQSIGVTADIFAHSAAELDNQQPVDDDISEETRVRREGLVRTDEWCKAYQLMRKEEEQAQKLIKKKKAELVKAEKLVAELKEFLRQMDIECEQRNRYLNIMTHTVDTGSRRVLPDADNYAHPDFDHILTETGLSYTESVQFMLSTTSGIAPPDLALPQIGRFKHSSPSPATMPTQHQDESSFGQQPDRTVNAIVQPEAMDVEERQNNVEVCGNIAII